MPGQNNPKAAAGKIVAKNEPMTAHVVKTTIENGGKIVKPNNAPV